MCSLLGSVGQEWRHSLAEVFASGFLVKLSSGHQPGSGSHLKTWLGMDPLSSSCGCWKPWVSWWAAGLGPSVPRWVSAWGCFSSLSVGVLWREDHDMRQLISSKPMRRVYREHLLARWKLEPCVVNSQMKSLLPYVTGPTRTQDKWMVWAWTPVKVGGCHWGHLGICPPQMGSEVWSFDFIWAVLCFGL